MKTVLYVVTVAIGLAGLMATFYALQYKLLPAWVMGAIGGSFFSASIIIGDRLILRRKTPNGANNRPEGSG